MHRKRRNKGAGNLPRSKKTSRSVKNKSSDFADHHLNTVTITQETEWLLRNFLTRWEKIALIEFYRDKINEILRKENAAGEDCRDSGTEHDLKRFGTRIKFIMERF